MSWDSDMNIAVEFARVCRPHCDTQHRGGTTCTCGSLHATEALERMQKAWDAAWRSMQVVHNGNAKLKARTDAIGQLLEANGCDCDCADHFEDHNEDCERCLACRVGEALSLGREPAP